MFTIGTDSAYSGDRSGPLGATAVSRLIFDSLLSHIATVDWTFPVAAAACPCVAPAR